MIGVALVGRLGNCLFEAAAISAIAKEHDLEWTADLCHVKVPDQLKDDLRLAGIPILDEPVICGASWDYHVLEGSHPSKIKDNTLFHGYYQSEEYFLPSADDIYKRYSKAGKGLPIHKGVCAVHVRRGDYLAPNIATYFTTQPESYYREAIARTPADQFWFFSDDIEWCAETFKDVPRVRFCKPISPLFDMQRGSRCEYVIGSNSSFSWWMAWLSDYRQGRPGKVILPANWYGPSNSHLTTDRLIPKHWVAR